MIVVYKAVADSPVAWSGFGRTTISQGTVKSVVDGLLAYLLHTSPLIWQKAI